MTKEKEIDMGILKEEMQLLCDLGNGYNEIDAFNHSMIASVVKPEDVDNTIQAIYTLRKNGKDAFFRKVVGELYAKQNCLKALPETNTWILRLVINFCSVT